MKAVIVLLCIALFSPKTLHAQQQTKPEPRGPGPNAALKYWQAFASMSRSLNSKSRKKVDSYAETPIDETALQAVAQCEHAIDFVQKAAKLPRCEWKIDLELGPSSTIEHYEPVRAIARLMCLSARRHFEKGLPSIGVKSCMAMFALGHHTGTDDLVICRLNQCAIETLAIITLARYLPKLDQDELRDLQQQITELPGIQESQLKSKDLTEGVAALKVRRQLLQAAITVQQRGPDAVNQFKDPYGNGPFQYRRLAKGFELSSALHKYVRVTVGQIHKD